MVIIDMKKTGKKIKILMKEKGLSVNELAILVGVSHNTVSGWIGGKSLPHITILVALSAVFQVPMEDMLSYHRKET